MAQFTNQAQLSYRDVVVDSNVAVGEIRSTLEITKTAVTEEYSRNGTLTYVLSLLNSGAGELTGLTLSDDLGGYTAAGETVYPLEYVEGSATAFLNGVLQSPPAAETASGLVFEDITLPAGSNYLLIYQARVTRFAPLTQGSTLTNTVTAAGGQTGPVTAQQTVTVAAAPDLTIQKSIEPVPVVENGQITYTLTVQNYGNVATAPGDSVTVTDTFDPILTDLTVAFNGTPWTEGTEYTYDSATGLFTTAPDQVTVPAATFTREASTGAVGIQPGSAVLTLTGTL